MKHFSDIQTLLDRYWEGETTLEEERLLKEYFNSGNYDPRFRNEAPLFQALRGEQNVQLVQTPKVVPMRPALYSWKSITAAASVALLIGAGAWWWTQKPADTQSPVAVQEKTLPASPEQAATRELHAAVLPAQTSDTAPKVKKFEKRRKKPSSKTQAPDPEAEMAMEEIKAALALVSSKIRKGRQEAAKGAIHLETVDIMLKKKTEG